MVVIIHELNRKSRTLTHRVLEPTVRVITRKRGVIVGCIQPEKQETFLEQHNIKPWPTKADGEQDRDYFVNQYCQAVTDYLEQTGPDWPIWKRRFPDYDTFNRYRTNVGLIRQVA